MLTVEGKERRAQEAQPDARSEVEGNPEFLTLANEKQHRTEHSKLGPHALDPYSWA
jgi:hypothetical protein